MEITISELAAQHGLTISHVCQLIKRGILPAGRKEGKTVYLPAVEAQLAIYGRRQLGPRKAKGVKIDKPNIDWSDLI